MKQPGELLTEIRRGRKIDWETLLKVMGRNGVAPSTLCLILEKESSISQKCTLRILDETAFQALESRFPPPVEITDRVSAAVAGDSHKVTVDGNILVVNQSPWKQPQVAVCWNGKTWSPLPQEGMHLLIVENLQNFLRIEDTLDTAYRLCNLQVHDKAIVIAYGAGNAATKTCNGNYYKNFSSINCLFDLDLGGIQTYATLKKQLAPFDIKPRFLFPNDVEERLRRSRFMLTDEERRKIHLAKANHPEIKALLEKMYHLQKKLEQETYLEGKNK